jgi:ABC-type multidrug transport system ATPase subunit
MKFAERLATEREEAKKEIFDNPILKEAREVQEKLEVNRPDMSLRVKDGYFKFIERIDEKEAEKKDAAAQGIETVYNGAPIQSAWQKIKRIISGRIGQFKIIEHYPVKNVNLFLEQGKTYLVLGAPRSGKSSLLRMIAGILPEDRDHEVGGSVKFNRFDPKSGEIVWSNLVGFIDQIDRLHPYLTVKETCEFAWRCRTGSTHKMPTMGDGAEIDTEIQALDDRLYAVMVVLEALGLTRVNDTFVGDQETVRGVSGGEKKRVTVGEMSVGGFPVMCMDEISTGLDGTLVIRRENFHAGAS